MELREIFDTAKAHLLNQYERAVNEYDSCALRGLQGNSCAIGCFISDEIYDESLEFHEPLSELMNRVHYDSDGNSHTYFNYIFGEYTEIKYSLLKRLQRMHDEFDPDRWTILLDKIEEDFFND